MDVFVSSPGQFTDSNRSRKRNITQSVGLDIATTYVCTFLVAGLSQRYTAGPDHMYKIVAKGGFYSERADASIISPNRRT